MPKFDFCLPTAGKAVPAGPEWFHEIKYDGYRLRLERDADRVRLITKGGNDWTRRFPWIVENALKNRVRQFVIDGEAIIRGVDGYSDFNALHSGKHNAEVEMLALDILALNGDDLRDLPSMCKRSLQRLRAHRAAGILVSDFKQGQSTPTSSGRLASSVLSVWCRSAQTEPARTLSGPYRWSLARHRETKPIA